jgi:hypothetical protein
MEDRNQLLTINNMNRIIHHEQKFSEEKIKDFGMELEKIDIKEDENNNKINNFEYDNKAYSLLDDNDNKNESLFYEMENNDNHKNYDMSKSSVLNENKEQEKSNHENSLDLSEKNRSNIQFTDKLIMEKEEGNERDQEENIKVNEDADADVDIDEEKNHDLEENPENKDKINENENDNENKNENNENLEDVDREKVEDIEENKEKADAEEFVKEEVEENLENVNEENIEEKKEENLEKDKRTLIESQKIEAEIAIVKTFPLLKTQEDASQRLEIFEKLKQKENDNENENGTIKSNEIDLALRNLYSFEEKFLTKEVISRAFISSKKSKLKRYINSEDEMEKNELRSFLVYLRQYTEYFEMFDLIETIDSKKIKFYEFSSALPVLSKWGIEIEDPKSAFDGIDIEGNGEILFQEFCHWAIQKNMELECEDENFDDEALSKEE